MNIPWNPDEETIRELMRQAAEGKHLNPEQLEAIRNYLAKKISEGTSRNFIEDMPNPPTQPPPGWWARLWTLLWTDLPWWLRCLWLIPIYMAGALVADHYVDPVVIEAGKGPCATTSTRVKMKVHTTSYGPHAAFKKAMNELETQCNNAGVNCTDPKCPTCGPDVQVSTVEINDWLLVYTCNIEADCGCWCK